MNCDSCLECPFYTKCVEQENEHKRSSAPMPVIGLYIAAASLICSLAMAADAILGFRQKKLWIPCKYFTINAASLTLLAVALKLPLDLNTSMPGCDDQLAKLSSTVFLCTAMANFFPFVGSMNNRDLLANMVALGILVVTLSVNVFIEMSTHVIGNLVIRLHIHTVCFSLALFVIMSLSALTVSTTKKYLEHKYNDLHKKASEEKLEGRARFEFGKLKKHLKIYWVMAESGDPQCVVARSVTCLFSPMLCIPASIHLVVAMVDCYFYADKKGSHSDYEWSIKVILGIQCVCIVIGTISPMSRLIVFTSMNFTNVSLEIFHLESYWTRRITEWKDEPLYLPIKGWRCRRLVQNTRNQIFNLCIIIQISLVFLCKFVQMIFSLIAIMFQLCFSWLGRHCNSEPELATESGLSNYIVLLEGEKKLPTSLLKGIYDSYSWTIQKGSKKQPINFLELLKNSTCSNGVELFCRDSIPVCWTLPIITLTSIAITLPIVNRQMVRKFVQQVSEGLSYARLIERSLGPERILLNVSEATEVLWGEVELYNKWLNNDLKELAHNVDNCKIVLEKLAGISTRINRNLEENLLNLPSKEAIAAKSMNDIIQILDQCISSNETAKEVFGRISNFVVDIFCACLVNLPSIITMKCYSNAIEERGNSVREAAQLLGETKEILSFPLNHLPPILDPNDAWCKILLTAMADSITATANPC